MLFAYIVKEYEMRNLMNITEYNIYISSLDILRKLKFIPNFARKFMETPLKVILNFKTNIYSAEN